jgi:hypothetical protein
MKGQTRAEGLMVKYHVYATTSLRPKVTDPSDVQVLDGAIQGMEKVLDLVYQRLENIILDGKTFADDLQEKIDLWSKERRKCLVKSFLCGVVYAPNACNFYGEAAANYKKSIDMLKVVVEEERKKERQRNPLVEKLSAASLPTEQNKFENFLREMRVDVTAEDRARYVENPDHMFFDVILQLREKYDHTGKI